MVGLTTAYYLAKAHPYNKVIVLDKNEKAMAGGSYQNGNVTPVNFTCSWINFPLYPDVYNSIFKSETYKSKTYLKTLFEDPCNIAVASKFALCWFFYQPTPQLFGQIKM